jgi:hypothetical protein
LSFAIKTPPFCHFPILDFLMGDELLTGFTCSWWFLYVHFSVLLEPLGCSRSSIYNHPFALEHQAPSLSPITAKVHRTGGGGNPFKTDGKIYLSPWFPPAESDALHFFEQTPPHSVEAHNEIVYQYASLYS